VVIDRQVVFANEIVRKVVGSTALGTAVEGTDDRDEMGVFIEPPEYVCGLESLDHYIQRDQPEGMPSQPGDLDLTLYSLRKFTKLAARGNPTVLMLFFSKEFVPNTLTGLGHRLLLCKSLFLSREAGQRFLGYMQGQKKRLLGERASVTNRPELESAHGYDTKFAMHALRLGLEGIEVMQTRDLVLPHHGSTLDTLRAVRAGQVSFDEVVKLITDAEAKLLRAIEHSTLPETVDQQSINNMLVNMHQLHWEIS